MYSLIKLPNVTVALLSDLSTITVPSMPVILAPPALAATSLIVTYFLVLANSVASIEHSGSWKLLLVSVVLLSAIG